MVPGKVTTVNGEGDSGENHCGMTTGTMSGMGVCVEEDGGKVTVNGIGVDGRKLVRGNCRMQPGSAHQVKTNAAVIVKVTKHVVGNHGKHEGGKRHQKLTKDGDVDLGEERGKGRKNGSRSRLEGAGKELLVPFRLDGQIRYRSKSPREARRSNEGGGGWIGNESTVYDIRHLPENMEDDGK